MYYKLKSNETMQQAQTVPLRGSTWDVGEGADSCHRAFESVGHTEHDVVCGHESNCHPPDCALGIARGASTNRSSGLVRARVQVLLRARAGERVQQWLLRQ
jgi:hypothetical protein